MSSLNRWALVLFVGLVCSHSTAGGDVTVRFEPADVVVDVGNLLEIAIVADISDPVLGWGLDLAVYDPAILSLVGISAIGHLWIPGTAPDGDGLVGLAFPNSVSGNDILLATLTFSADAIGETDLYTFTTPTDLTEGFPLDPTGFADVIFEPGHVTVVPEPLTFWLLAMSGLAAMKRRR